MKCNEVREQLPDYWTGKLDESERGELQAHFETCVHCRGEAEKLGSIWKKLGGIPEERPSRAARPRFEATLDAYVQGLRQAERGPGTGERLNKWLEGWWPRQPAYQFGFAVVFLAFGALAGHTFTSASQGTGELVRLREEVRNTRQLVTLSLLQQQSASERLKGVDWSSRISQPDPKVLSALLHTVDYDPNVNVRLAALDALHQSASNNMVREGLVDSLERQTSPLVQIAVIDLLVEIRQKEAADTLHEMAREPEINPEVRERAQWALGVLK